MDTDRNLLFGVLALQADVITASQFVEACTLWASRKDTPLADLLAGRGWLTAEDRTHVGYLLERKLQKHHGDARPGLAEAAPEPVRRSLAALADADVQASLAGLPDGVPVALGATVAYQPQGRDRYLLTRLHARGGMGQVWLARDTDLGRDVALKELRPERQGDPAVMARLLEEGRVTGQLEHPGIVPVYELIRDREGGRPFYTMRFIGGRTLREAARAYHRKRADGKAGPLELRELLGAFVAVCQAVAYAHARGVLHRDLKPQNVVLGDFGEVMVIDWGLAKVVGRADDASSLPVAVEGTGGGETVQGAVLGTPAYMAPEQAEGRHDLVDRRSDVYGLGAILYEILTGQPPFPGADSKSVLARIRREPPAPPRSVVAELAPTLEAVCLKALAKRREDRYAAAKDLASEVQHWLADEPTAAYAEPWALKARRWLGRSPDAGDGGRGRGPCRHAHPRGSDRTPEGGQRPRAPGPRG
jgi:tRNA A-37 threonylcarbamoyl transferase component Bud32